MSGKTNRISDMYFLFVDMTDFFLYSQLDIPSLFHFFYKFFLFSVSSSPSCSINESTRASSDLPTVAVFRGQDTVKC